MPRFSRLCSAGLRALCGWACRAFEQIGRACYPPTPGTASGRSLRTRSMAPWGPLRRRPLAVPLHTRKGNRRPARDGWMVGTMKEWIRGATQVVTTLVASIWASRRVARKRDFEILLERMDREATKREQAIRELMDRSDRKFEAVLARSDELTRQSAETTGRLLRTEAVLGTVEAGVQRAAAQPAPATGETEMVAAQAVPGGRPTE